MLASGEVVTASADENPDLFWGIRGGGGNFGVVVDFTFEAHEVGPEVALAAVFHDAAAGAELMPQSRDLALRAGDEVTTRALYWSMPAVEDLPPPIQGKDVFLIGALYAGDKQDGQGIIDEFRNLGTPLFDLTDWPKWHAALGLIAAALGVLGLIAVIQDTNGGSVWGFIGFIAMLIWALATSVLLIAEPSQASPT